MEHKLQQVCHVLDAVVTAVCHVLYVQHTTYLVSNLSPNTEYSFRVCAINRHGYSDPGPPSDVIVTLDKLQALKPGQFH